MLNTINAENLIGDMYWQILGPSPDSAFPKAANEDPNLALHFQLHVKIENYGFEAGGMTCHNEWKRKFDATVHILVTARRRVYSAIINVDHYAGNVHEIANIRSVDPAFFRNTSNHDTCWRHDGLSDLLKVIRDGYQHCYGFMPAEHKPVLASICPYTTFGDGWFTCKPLSFVRVERKPLPKEKSNGGYLDQLTAITPVGFKIVLEN